MSEYEIIQQQIADAETAISLADDLDDALGVCVILLDLIKRLERRTAPQ